jgi:hypothetical protein
MVRLCRCSLSGRAHYARRCPLCGLHRDLGRAPWPVDPREVRAARRLAAEQRRQQALELLRRIAELCQREAPARPVATPPRRELSWHERRAWERRAYDWELARLGEIEAELEEPVRLMQDLERWPAQARYVRAARRLVGAYARRMEAAGWKLKL